MHTLQQSLPMLFNEVEQPQKLSHSLWGIWTPSSHHAVPQTSPRSVKPFLQGSWTWPTDTQTTLLRL